MTTGPRTSRAALPTTRALWPRQRQALDSQLRNQVSAYRTDVELAELHAILDRYDDDTAGSIRQLLRCA